MSALIANSMKIKRFGTFDGLHHRMKQNRVDPKRLQESPEQTEINILIKDVSLPLWGKVPPPRPPPPDLHQNLDLGVLSHGWLRPLSLPGGGVTICFHLIWTLEIKRLAGELTPADHRPGGGGSPSRD